MGVAGKSIADVGAGCSTLGIVLAQNGAKEIVGTDINPASVECSQKNIQNNRCQTITQIKLGNSLQAIEQYNGYFDFIVSGIPWNFISNDEFGKLPVSDQSIYRSFFDVDNYLIKSLMIQGWSLIKKHDGKIYISACLNIMDRIEVLTKEHKVHYSILAEEDIHQDGNMHYILELTRWFEQDL